jgi:inosose dehydratase
MTRRAFLVGTAGASALAGVQAALASAPGMRPAVSPPQRFRIGYQIFGWSRYFPSAWWRGADAVGALGYPGIEGEYTIAELYEGREEEFEARMRRAGVALAAFYSTTDLERPRERHENTRKNLFAASFARRMGCRMIVIGGTEAKDKAPEAYARWASEANELGRRLLGEHGVRLGVHPHVGALIESRENIDRVMDATDPRSVFLAPDTGHLLAGGSDPVDVFRTYRDRIAHAHLKDYARPASAGARGAFLPLGKGQIDFPALIRILRDAKFDGWLDVELDGGRGIDPAQVATHAREYVTNVLGLALEPQKT